MYPNLHLLTDYFPLRIYIVPQKYVKLLFWSFLPSQWQTVEYKFYYFSPILKKKKIKASVSLQLVSLSPKTFNSLKIIPPTKDEIILP